MTITYDNKYNKYIVAYDQSGVPFFILFVYIFYNITVVIVILHAMRGFVSSVLCEGGGQKELSAV